MIGKNIKIFKELDSTNDFVKLNVSNIEDGSIVVAEKQTKGRGLRENSWESINGNLYFSIVHKNNIVRVDVFKYIVYSSVSIIRTLESLGIEGKIKYPNDCLVNSKKISGILIESSGSSSLEYIVIGIGLNINQIDFNYLKDKATSTKLITKKDLNIIEVLEEFVSNYNEVLDIDYDKVFNEYLGKSIVIGKKISYRGEEYIINDIEKSGIIIIRNNDSNLRVSFNEISLKELY